MKFIARYKHIFIILISGLVLRLISLNQSFWLDETTSGYVARDLGYLDILTKFSPGDFHPPLYYLLLKTWGSLFGFGEVPLRMFSVVFSLIGVYLVYLIAKNIANQKVAITASLFAATAPLWLYYSQEARMYALETTLALILVYVFVLIEEKQNLIRWLVFSLAFILLVFTDYLPALMIFVLALFGLLTKKDKRWWGSFSLSFVGPVILFLFWLPIFIQQLTVGLEVKEAAGSWWTLLGTISLKNLGLIPVKFILGRISFDNKTLYGGIVGGVSIVFSYILLRPFRDVWQSRSRNNPLKLIWLWLLVPLVLGVVVSLKISVLSYFRFIFILPAVYLLLAYGVLGIKKKSLKIFMVVFVLAVNLLSSFYYLATPRFHRENWRGLVGFLGQQKTTNISSLVVTPANSQTEGFRYYDPEATIKVVGPDGISSKYAIIWLMRYIREIFDPQDQTRSKIESLGYQKIGEYDFNGVVVWKYQK